MMFILMFSNFHLIIPSPLMEWWLNQKEPTNDTTLESTNAYTTRFNRKWIWFCRIRSVLQRQTRAENADQQCKVSTIRLWPSQDILLPTSLNKRCFFWLPSSFPVIYNPCNVPAMDLTTVMSPSTERKSDGQLIGFERRNLQFFVSLWWTVSPPWPPWPPWHNGQWPSCSDRFSHCSLSDCTVHIRINENVQHF